MAGGKTSELKSRPAGRPSAEAAGGLEEELMDAALAVFIAAGYAGASMEAIARKAGVTERTLYLRAGSKAALFVAVVERLAGRAGVPSLAEIVASRRRC